MLCLFIAQARADVTESLGSRRFLSIRDAVRREMREFDGQYVKMVCPGVPLYGNRHFFRASCLWRVGESCLDGSFGHHALGAVLPRIQQPSIYQLRYPCRANAKHASGVRRGDGGDVAELAADGHGDNLAAVLWLVSKVRRGKIDAAHKMIVDHACEKIGGAFDSVV